MKDSKQSHLPIVLIKNSNLFWKRYTLINLCESNKLLIDFFAKKITNNTLYMYRYRYT